jgi:hypothetical protein
VCGDYRIVRLLFDVSAKELAKRATLRYGLPRKLAPVLETSGRWGRIKVEIVCSMTSKYAIALYELIQLRANMERCVETFPIDRFRELLGVPPGTYARADNFSARCSIRLCWKSTACPT